MNMRPLLRYTGLATSAALCGLIATLLGGCGEVQPDDVSIERSPEERQVSQKVADWLEARQERLQIVATTRTRSGQIIDWVPIESQVPPGEAVATPPPAPHARALLNVPTTELEVDTEARGPAGTVPLLRPDVERIHAPGSVADFLSRSGRAGVPNGVIWQQREDSPAIKPRVSGGNERFYAGSFKNVTNYGVDAIVNVWNPFVEQGFFTNDMSLAQIAVTRGSNETLQTIEAGWQEDPDRYGEGNPRFFIYYTRNGYTQDGHNLGGYNSVVAGWVQVSTTVFPGSVALSPTSTAGAANQYEIWLSWQYFQGDWWLWYINQWIGYYPGTLFDTTGLRSQASHVAVQGEVADSSILSTTTTDMGSGSFASSGFGSAAYMRQITYFTAANGGSPTKYTSPTLKVTNSNCYDHVSGFSSTDPFWLSHFFFGGPGHNPSCP
ncbi:neprosin family prolyl endopeptidase [Sorangium sp. So ce118]